MTRPTLPSVYSQEFPEEVFERELRRVHRATEIERRWIDAAGLKPYPTDESIQDAVSEGELVRVSQGLGYRVIQRLFQWPVSPTYAGQAYSPPYVRPEALTVLEAIAADWHAETGVFDGMLAITSLIRSEQYQAALRRQPRKVTLKQDSDLSSHQVGIAFDIDAIGVYLQSSKGAIRPHNPRAEDYSHGLAISLSAVLRDVLSDYQADGRINFVEELAGTQENCMHVAVRPS